MPQNQPDTVLIAPGQQSSVEFLVEHIGSSSTDITVQFDLARSLPSSWSDPVWSPPAGVALQGGGDSSRPILSIEAPNGDLSTAPDKLEIVARAYSEIDGTT